MRTRKKMFAGLVVCIAAAAVYGLILRRGQASKSGDFKEIRPRVGDIRTFISATGEVRPRNRLPLRPPVSGRIEEMLVKEGDRVESGQLVAWMSSTDRAALLDAARAEGEAALSYWKEVYKPIPVVSFMDGEVIVRAAEPGRNINTNDDIIVLSDRLIVRAQVDETDIGKVEAGQEAIISLDAYPRMEVKGDVTRIAYESREVSNVRIYDVEIIPVSIPGVFRAGMSANINIIEEERQDALTIPASAVRREGGETYVLVKEEGREAPAKRSVRLGISDFTNVEVLSGLSEKDTVLEESIIHVESRTGTGSPFSGGSGTGRFR